MPVSTSAPEVESLFADFPGMRLKVEQKLPVVMSIGEVQTLLKLIEKPSMHCYFTVVYHLGLRLNEALHLQISDIDSKRWMVHIHHGKGALPLNHPTQ